MIFKIILSMGYKPELVLLIYLIVISFILSIAGCATTETQRVSSDNIAYKTDYKIINVIMKNGLVIDLQDKSPIYFREYDNKKNVILYTAVDTIQIYDDSLSVTPVTKIIELDDVKKVTIEKSGTTVVMPILMIGGFAVLMALLGIFSWYVNGW